MEKRQLPIIAILGPTATGKSALAYALAQAWKQHQSVAGVVLISVDSRQVYQGLEIISGVDLPSSDLKLNGVSLVKPDQEWSVSHFCQLARPLLSQAAEKNQGVILVGGTGLYHQQLFELDQAMLTPPNEQLRQDWAEAELEDLQRAVAQQVPSRWAEMNESDRHNPRRLIRVLEIAQSSENLQVVSLPPLPPYELVRVGLTASPEFLAERIAQRVEARFREGAIGEVERLMADYTTWQGQAFSATGVKEIRAFLEGGLTQEECLSIWSRRELQYAKRQRTWWRKQTPELSIDIEKTPADQQLSQVVALMKSHQLW